MDEIDQNKLVKRVLTLPIEAWHPVVNPWTPDLQVQIHYASYEDYHFFLSRITDQLSVYVTGDVTASFEYSVDSNDFEERERARLLGNLHLALYRRNLRIYQEQQKDQVTGTNQDERVKRLNDLL